jgi:hypothetical protein
MLLIEHAALELITVCCPTELRARYAAAPGSQELKEVLRRDIDDFARRAALQVPTRSHAATSMHGTMPIRGTVRVLK